MTKLAIKLPVAGCLLLVAAGCICAESVHADAADSGRRHPADAPSSHMADAHTWEVRFSHRFNQSVDGNGIHSLFGLDSGANVGLGLSYVPFRDLELALERQSTLETFEGSLKYALMQQARALPFSSAIRAGGDWRNARDLEDRASYFAQAIVSRQFGSRLDIYAVPTFITKAGRVVSGNASVALFDHAFNVPVGALVQIVPGLSLVGEVIAEEPRPPERHQVGHRLVGRHQARDRRASVRGPADEQQRHDDRSVRHLDLQRRSLQSRRPPPRLQHRAAVGKRRAALINVCRPELILRAGMRVLSTCRMRMRCKPLPGSRALA